MSEPTAVERTIRISADRSERLGHLARAHRVSEDRIVEKALNILFSVTELLDGEAEQRGWSSLSEASLARVWDNDDDARYDDWGALYGVAAR